jgi:hypothetical protein
MNLINVELKTGKIKPGDAATLGLGALDTKNQQFLTNLGPAMQEAQAGLSLALATHGNVSSAKAAEASLYRQQAALGGIGPNQLAYDLYQLGQQGKIATPGAQLIRSPESGLGDALLGAGSGAGTAAQLSRSARATDPLAETVRHLQLIIARDEKIIQELQRANDHLVTLTDEVAAGGATSGGHPVANRGPARRGFGVS